MEGKLDMGKVKVSIMNNQSEVKVPVGIRLLIRKCCHAVTESESFKGDSEVSVSFVNDERIHELVERKGAMADALVDGKIQIDKGAMLDFLLS